MIRGLGAVRRLRSWLEDRGGLGRDALIAGAEHAARQGRAEPGACRACATNGLAAVAASRAHASTARRRSRWALAVDDVYNAIQLMLAPVYANDFFYQGRVLRVQHAGRRAVPHERGCAAATSIYRRDPAEPTRIRASSETTSDGWCRWPRVVSSQWVVAPPTLQRYNGFAAMRSSARNAPGNSSGEAMNEMKPIVAQDLPPGFGFDWAGQSLQEILSGAEAPLLFGLSIFVVFLCLAALYESWSIPVAVLLVVPRGHHRRDRRGAPARGLPNDVFFKIGLITIIGLAAKNAILIVEFALLAQQRGMSLYEAVMEAARLRLRPILMTSFAFILGVLPLVFSSGAGANARHAIGTGVAGGMLSAAILGVLLAPIFYVTIRRMAGDKFSIEENRGWKPERLMNVS